MAARSVRRRQHKQTARLATLPERQRQAEAQYWLARWSREARRRATFLSAPEVWDLARSPGVQHQAAALDPSGELQQDLERVCAEAIAAVVDRSLVPSSRPVAAGRRG